MTPEEHDEILDRLEALERTVAILTDRWGMAARFGVPLLAAVVGAIMGRGL